LAECLGRARSTEDIPALLRVYEKLRKPRTERIKKAAEASGNYKILEEGPARQRRDKGFAERLDKNSPQYEASRGYAHVKWLYGYDVFESVSSSDCGEHPLTYKIRLERSLIKLSAKDLLGCKRRRDWSRLFLYRLIINFLLDSAIALSN